MRRFRTVETRANVAANNTPGHVEYHVSFPIFNQLESIVHHRIRQRSLRLVLQRLFVHVVVIQRRAEINLLHTFGQPRQVFVYGIQAVQIRSRSADVFLIHAPAVRGPSNGQNRPGHKGFHFIHKRRRVKRYQQVIVAILALLFNLPSLFVPPVRHFSARDRRISHVRFPQIHLVRRHSQNAPHLRSKPTWTRQHLSANNQRSFNPFVLILLAQQAQRRHYRPRISKRHH